MYACLNLLATRMPLMTCVVDLSRVSVGGVTWHAVEPMKDGLPVVGVFSTRHVLMLVAG